MKKLQAGQACRLIKYGRADLSAQFSTAIRTDSLLGGDDETAVRTGGRLYIAQRPATGQAAWLPNRVGRAAVFTREPGKFLRQGVGGVQRSHGPLDGFPGVFTELYTLDILGQIVQPAQKAERIAQRGHRGMAEARRQTEPGLLANVHQDAVFDGLQIDGHCGRPAGSEATACSYLYGHAIFVAQHLCVHAAAVELCHERLGNVIWFDIAMKNSSFHVFDYNPFTSDDGLSSCFMSLKNIYAMKQVWFKAVLGGLAIPALVMGFLLFPVQAAAFQDLSTPTGITVTVTYTDPINVRSGPSTILYPIVAQLNPGEVVPALGISPGREWIQISYPGGTGWVYASFVSIAGGELRIVEPPPTPTPLITSTIDPTLAAQFAIQPTSTRLPTFTPPAPLEVVDVTPGSRAPRMVAPGIFIVTLGFLGAIGLAVSFLLRR